MMVWIIVMIMIKLLIMATILILMILVTEKKDITMAHEEEMNQSTNFQKEKESFKDYVITRCTRDAIRA